MVWRNLLTFHHRLMARYLERRGWIAFYLEPEARECTHGTCWLQLYLSEKARR